MTQILNNIAMTIGYTFMAIVGGMFGVLLTIYWFCVVHDKIRRWKNRRRSSHKNE